MVMSLEFATDNQHEREVSVAGGLAHHHKGTGSQWRVGGGALRAAEYQLKVFLEPAARGDGNGQVAVAWRDARIRMPASLPPTWLAEL